MKNLSGFNFFLTFKETAPNSLSLSLSLSSRVVVDQRTRPQVHATSLHLQMPPRLRWFSDRLISGCNPCSLFEDDGVLYCRALAGITHRFIHILRTYCWILLNSRNAKKLCTFLKTWCHTVLLLYLSAGDFGLKFIFITSLFRWRFNRNAAIFFANKTVFHIFAICFQMSLKWHTLHAAVSGCLVFT